jgi:hypothetical protein
LIEENFRGHLSVLLADRTIEEMTDILMDEMDNSMRT